MDPKKLDSSLLGIRCHSQALVRVETAGDKKVYSHYEIFNGPQELYARIASAPASISFHEITRIATDPFSSPQKMYFDIDAGREKWGSLSGQEVERRAATAIIDAAQKWACEVGFRGTLRAYVAGSSDYLTKVSLHIIFPDLLFKDHGPLKRAALRVMSYLEPWLANCVDILYKKNQGLRLLWAHKVGTSRQKIPLQAYGVWPADSIAALAESTIHTYSAAPQHCIDNLAPAPMEWSYLGTESTSDLMAMLGALEEMEQAGGGDSLPPGGAYREESSQFLQSGTVRISLRRTAPSHCIVCQRLHDSENPYVVRRNGEYRLYCRRASPQANGKAQSTLFYVDEKLRAEALAVRKEAKTVMSPNQLRALAVAREALEKEEEYEDWTPSFPSKLELIEDDRSAQIYDDEIEMRIDLSEG
jgi:hypothetical protein